MVAVGLSDLGTCGCWQGWWDGCWGHQVVQRVDWGDDVVGGRADDHAEAAIIPTSSGGYGGCGVGFDLVLEMPEVFIHRYHRLVGHQLC